MITSINKVSYPNTLIVILAQGDGKSNFEEKADVTRVTDGKGELTGFNFFNVDRVLDYDKLPNGEVKLDEDQVAALNEKLASVGFSDKLTVAKPTLVYGYVKECVAHPDSDHLHVTQIDVGDGQDHQIVCGAPNIAQGQKVVVALPGTLMPNGAQIWPGALRGVESDGMICSARELGLAHAPQKRGIMVVPDSFKIGDEFEPTKCDELLASGAITL
ncbi:YtpR family tRNA-binding protein [Lactobacillus delbrueckii subsp. bulgaricus]